MSACKIWNVLVSSFYRKELNQKLHSKSITLRMTLLVLYNVLIIFLLNILNIKTKMIKN